MNGRAKTCNPRCSLLPKCNSLLVQLVAVQRALCIATCDLQLKRRLKQVFPIKLFETYQILMGEKETYQQSLPNRVLISSCVNTGLRLKYFLNQFYNRKFDLKKKTNNLKRTIFSQIIYLLNSS